MRTIRVPIGLTDAEICELADKCARHAMMLPDLPVIHTVSAYRERLEKFVRLYGIEPPERPRITRNGKRVGVEDRPAIARMTDPQWWRLALRRYQARALEREAIALGIVHRGREPYASNATVERRAQQKRRNAATLEAAEAVNLDTAEIYKLAELAEKANSNPAIRRGELMIRIRGFEEIARGLDHAAEFITVTAPSKYHAKKIVDGGKVIDNPKFCGATPRDAQKYLAKTWAKCRAALWRRGIRPYGFRIVEPHHDGTPHWHMLLFVDRWLSAGRSAVARMRAIIRRYFLREDVNEAGAKANRCEFVAIDWRRGSAAGYVAKYVSKNIDGYAVQADLEAECDAVTGSQRVEAWASTWGIRQFQQIGGAPVGVWRELRRIKELPEDASEAFAAAWRAAGVKDETVADWGRYTAIQGGPNVMRADLRLRVAYTRPGERVAGGETEPAPPNRYGEVARPAVFGVRDVVRDRAHLSRFYRWEIRYGVGSEATRTCVNNCSRPSAAEGIEYVGSSSGEEVAEIERSIQGGRGSVATCAGARASHGRSGHRADVVDGARDDRRNRGAARTHQQH